MYVGREPRGSSKRFVMSAAKDIVILAHSEEDSLNASKKAGSNGSGDTTGTRAVGTECSPAVRRRLPDERHSLTHHFSVGGQEGYVTVGLYEDGVPGELFIRMAKEGSTVSGLMDSFATAVSLALQYGVPLRVLCDKFSVPILWLTDGEERILLSVHDLWQHERMLINRRTGVRHGKKCEQGNSGGERWTGS
jgi:hypothetical protein